MATVSTVPADLVSAAATTAASNASASGLLRYDAILADACAFNRRLRKGRVDRPDFFDTATQTAQRPAPWLHRSVQARTKTRGVISRPQASVNDCKQQQPPQTSLGLSAIELEASLSGSVSLSGEGSCHSSATQNSVNNSTTASNGGERRTSAGEMQQPQASPSLEDLGGQRYDSYGARYAEDDDSERSKLKFRRKIIGMGYKSSVVRRYHRRLGVAVCGRPRGRRGVPGRCDVSGRWTSIDGSAGGLQAFDAAYDEESPDGYTPPDEAVYRSNANILTIGLHDGPPAKPPNLHSNVSETSELVETTIVPRTETPTSFKHHHHHQHHHQQHLHHQPSGQPPPPPPPPPSTAPASTLAATTTPMLMMMSHYHPQQPLPCGGADKRSPTEGTHDPGSLEWRNAVHRHHHANGSDAMNNSMPSEGSHLSASPPLPSLPPARAPAPAHQSKSNPTYQQHHSSPLSTPTQQQQAPPPPAIQSNAPPPPVPPPPPPPPPPVPPSNSAPVPPEITANHTSGGGGNNHGHLGSPPPQGGGGGSPEPTTVVTFFVCEVCASRYRSTAGLRYHYHSQHAGYTPRNPISASASRISIPTSEYNRFAPNTGPRGGRNGRTKRSRNNYPSYRTGGTNKGRGLSTANQQIVSQRSAGQAPEDGGESDPYRMPSANTPEEPHPRSVYSSSSEPQQTESSLSSVNSSSYISPIKLKSPSEMDYLSSGSRGKPFSGYAPAPPLPPPPSSAHQPPPPPYDQPPYYGAPSALASMDHMASSLLRQQQHHHHQQQQQQQPLHSLLAQLHPTAYKHYGDSSSHYYAHQSRAYAGGRPSFVELRSMLRQRRAQYPADAFTCGYCHMHVEGGGGAGGAGSGADSGAEGEGVSYARCFGCGMPVHHFCILRYRISNSSNCSRTPNSQRLCYPWVCTECKSCWICGSGANEELIICCCECDRGYHGYCLTGSSPGYQAAGFPDDWVCEICRQQDACLPPQPPTIH